MTLNDIQTLMSNDIEANNQYIIDQLSSDVVLINQISQYIIHSGGKRLRPLLVMLIARALESSDDRQISAAAVIEFIHTATLLHDGKETANNVFGNAASVLTGDFLYSRAFQIMVELNSMDVMQTLADATNKIAEGEVLQLMNCNNANVDEARYMNVIYCKTSKLFEAACEVSGLLAKVDLNTRKQLREYGEYLGNAFQLTDDVLDFLSDAETMGKNVGDDLAEGKPTLPVIHAIQHANEADKHVLVDAIEKGSTENIDQVIKIIKATGSIDYTKEKALHYAKQAKLSITGLKASAYKDALLTLCEIAVSRVA